MFKIQMVEKSLPKAISYIQKWEGNSCVKVDLEFETLYDVSCWLKEQNLATDNYWFYVVEFKPVRVEEIIEVNTPQYKLRKI